MAAIPIPYHSQLRREARIEWVFRTLTVASAALVLVILAGVLIALVYGGWPAIKTFKFGFLTREVWNPVTDQFGALAALYGTVITSLIAMLIAVPLAFGIAGVSDRDLSDVAARTDFHLHRAAGGGAEHCVWHLGTVRTCAGAATHGATISG